MHVRVGKVGGGFYIGCPPLRKWGATKMPPLPLPGSAGTVCQVYKGTLAQDRRLARWTHLQNDLCCVGWGVKLYWLALARWIGQP